MKVVLDTNVLVSALLKRDSVPGQILQAVWDGTLDLVLSEPLLAELRAVLDYPKIRKRLVANAIDRELFLELLPFFTIQVDLAGTKVPRPRDAADQMVLATLVAGQAEWLVTGDADLLVLADQFPILTPAAFVARFLA
ncbi:MAG: putative toxin-antitoxin system toxin component, PIN family [Woeseiaceae bacterium]|nr:putative toxin-antitoxin system toxin component, PIN family [Woeseiaceae bacterium]